MALSAPAPTVELANLRKTWNNFDVNNAINTGVQATNARTLLYQVKEWIKTITGMSVRDSCLDTALSSLGTDLIASQADVVMAATGTWIVFDHTSGYQVMIHAAGATTIGVTVAPLGDFTAGTTTVNPATSTTAHTVSLSVNGTSQILWNGAATSDGNCFYVFTVGSSVPKGFAGVFEGNLIDERANSSDFAFIYAAGASTTPNIGLTLNGVQVTPSYITAGGFATVGGGTTSTSYGGRYAGYRLGAGATPIVYMNEIYDIYLCGNIPCLFADRALSGAAAAEMLFIGTNWMVPWNNTVLQVV